MAEFKLVISDPKARKAYSVELKSPDADKLIGKKIGEKVSGEIINLAGFEFQITGGSDKQGFPIRPEIEGTKRIRALLKGGAGMRAKQKGERKRKSVRGNQISEEISQINLKVVKQPEKSLGIALGKEIKEEEKSEKGNQKEDSPKEASQDSQK